MYIPSIFLATTALYISSVSAGCYHSGADDINYKVALLGTENKDVWNEDIVYKYTAGLEVAVWRACRILMEHRADKWDQSYKVCFNTRHGTLEFERKTPIPWFWQIPDPYDIEIQNPANEEECRQRIHEAEKCTHGGEYSDGNGWIWRIDPNSGECPGDIWVEDARGTELWDWPYSWTTK